MSTVSQPTHVIIFYYILKILMNIISNDVFSFFEIKSFQKFFLIHLLKKHVQILKGQKSIGLANRLAQHTNF